MTHADIINYWPSIGAFADDIGVDPNTAKQMRTRSSINSKYWVNLVSGAKRRNIMDAGVDELMSSISPTPQGTSE